MLSYGYSGERPFESVQCGCDKAGIHPSALCAYQHGDSTFTISILSAATERMLPQQRVKIKQVVNREVVVTRVKVIGVVQAKITA